MGGSPLSSAYLFLLITRFTLHIAFVNSGEVLGVCTRRDSLDWSLDSSIAGWHRLTPLLAEFVEIMSQESVTGHGSPDRGTSEGAYDAGQRINQLCPVYH